jgi:hypothetical protein
LTTEDGIIVDGPVFFNGIVEGDHGRFGLKRG